jgi:hypothetical protein
MQQQVPKVKIGEKITALQQIVSPFGKVRAYFFPTNAKFLCSSREEPDKECYSLTILL